MTNEEEEILKQVDENLSGKLSFDDLNVPLVDENAPPRPHVVLREAFAAINEERNAYITAEEDLAVFFLAAMMVEGEIETRARACPCSGCVARLAEMRNAKKLAERISEVYVVRYKEGFLGGLQG